MKYSYRQYLQMFFTLFLIWFSTSIGNAQSSSSRVLVSYQKTSLTIKKGTKLNKALKIVEKRFDVVFLYKSRTLKNKRTHHRIQLSNDVKQAIKQLLDGYSLKSERTNYKTYGIYPTNQPEKTIQKPSKQADKVSGTVTDAGTGKTMPGVNIVVKGTQNGTSTNAKGHYELTVESLQDTLVFTFVGYNKRTIPIQGRTSINVVLKQKAIGLNKMVVTGYGQTSRRELSSSVATVKSEDIEEVPIASVGQALQGKAAGVNITASAGTPGSVQNFRIRGISSINAGTSPLFVIDGVPVPEGNFISLTAQGSFGRLSNLNPSDISSVNILKGASATAAYGARGSNGVVVIKTKEGSKKENTTFTVSAQSGFNRSAIEPPDVLNNKQYVNNYYTAAENRLLVQGKVGTKEVVNQVYGPPPGDPNVNTDWQDIVHNNHAAQDKFSLSAQGGDDRTTFYASGAYFKQHGQLKAGGLNRISGRLNISHDLNENFTIKNNFTGSYASQNGYLQTANYFGSPVTNQYFLLPTLKAYNTDGTPNLNLSGVNHYNPIYIRKNDINLVNHYRLLNNTTLKLDILHNLSVESQFSIDLLLDEEKSYDNPNYGDGASVGGRDDDIDNRNFNYVWKNTLKYISSLNENNTLTARVITESQRNYFRYLEGFGTGEPAGGLINLNTIAQPKYVGSSTTDWATQSFSGLLNYNYRDKFYLNGSIREEANSRFAPGVRWGTFYSLGASYILTEDLITGVRWLNSLKLRASFGKTGNSSINLNQYQSLVGFGNYAGKPVTFTSSLGNKDLTWENQREYDAGLDFTIFDNVDGSVSFYQKNGYSLLFNVPLSRTTGFNSQTRNLGKLYNRGVEVELSAQIINSNNFAWKLGGNFTFNKNKVTHLPKDPNGSPRDNITSTKYIAEEGYPVRSWYMKEWAGVDPANGDPLWYKNVLDANGNPTGERTTTNNYNSATKYYQDASAQPTKYGGLNTRFNFSDFSVSANLYYAFGNKIYDNWAFDLSSDGRYPYINQYATQTDHWEKKGDHAKNPKLIRGGNKLSNSISTRYLFNGSYIRLKTVRIGYHMPVEFLSKIRVKKATVYFLAQNLWTHTFDDDLNFDPEVGADGFTQLNAAQLKSITFGVNINF